METTLPDGLSGFWVFLVHPPMASVLLSASVERCFVSRMRDFFLYIIAIGQQVKNIIYMEELALMVISSKIWEFSPFFMSTLGIIQSHLKSFSDFIWIYRLKRVILCKKKKKIWWKNLCIHSAIKFKLSSSLSWQFSKCTISKLEELFTSLKIWELGHSISTW